MWELTDKRNATSTATIYLISVEFKSRLLVLLCHVVPMPIVQLVLKDDITKLISSMVIVMVTMYFTY